MSAGYVMSDADFEQRLTDYLAQFSEGLKPIVPLMTSDGTVAGVPDRVETLKLPCYREIGDAVTEALLAECAG